MTLAHAIMALLVEYPYSGYDLSKELNDCVNCFWTASHQQIYSELAKLESKSWVISKAFHQENRPDKKLYFLTEQGRQHLIEWIFQPSIITGIKEDLLVKTLVGYLVPHEIILRELETRCQFHLEKLAFLQSQEQEILLNFQKLSPETKFHYLILRRGIHYHTGWIAWCGEALQLLITSNHKNSS
jgi:DNA-binding PadR family transcriptional regulator